MSLVGPRPELPEIVRRLEALIPFYDARLLVLPGLTGWARSTRAATPHCRMLPTNCATIYIISSTAPR